MSSVSTVTAKVIGLVVGICLATPSHALDFQFSITNIIGSVPGTVTGLIQGLEDNTSNQAADHVIVTGYPAGLTGLPAAPIDYVPAVHNEFTVLNGSITEVSFLSFLGNSLGGSLCFSSAISCSGEAFYTNLNTAGAVTETVIGTMLFSPVVAVPGPIVGAGLPGLLLATGVLLAWYQRKKQVLLKLAAC